MINQAAEQSYSSIKVNLKEEEEQLAEKIKVINRELEQHLDWCEDIRAEINLYKEELSECDDRDSNREKTKSEETDELKRSHTGADGILFQDDCGSSEGVTWQETSSETEVCRKDAGSTDTKSQHSQETDPSDKITTHDDEDEAEETEEAEETCETGTGGKI